MVFPENRFSFTRQKYGKRKRLHPFLLFSIIVLCGTGIFLSLRYRIFDTIFTHKRSNDEILLALWDEKRYSDINAFCEEILKDEPLNVYALVFNGFSYYYRGELQFNAEDKIPFFRNAVTNLRKTLLLQHSYMVDGIFFVLGKSYFNLGKYYMDASVHYLNSAIDMGYSSDDMYEYLGLAYYNLGRYDACLEAFHNAYELHPTDTISLSLAQTYFSLEDYGAAEEFLLRTINKSEDFAILQKSRFLLGKLYMETEDYLKAEKFFNEILDLNPQSADAHYFLGEIYLSLGDKIKARYEWREALRIDPNHHGSKLRLYP